MKNWVGLVAVAAALLVGGCAATPEIPFDRTSAGEVRTIGLVTPAMPEKANIVLATSVGKNLGLIGALVDAGMQANRESTFQDLVVEQNFSVPTVFVAELKRDLEKLGYTVIDVPVPRPDADFVPTYPKAADSKVDAYLDVVVKGYGYVAAGIGSSGRTAPATSRARAWSAHRTRRC